MREDTPRSRPTSPLSDLGTIPDEQPTVTLKSRWMNSAWLRPIRRTHQRIPGVNKVPLRAIGIIGLLIMVNIIVWIAVAIVLRYYPDSKGTGRERSPRLVTWLTTRFRCRSYLREYHDIFTAFPRLTIPFLTVPQAIDLMTRRLLATGQKAVTVGTFFSLGHSTIVIITSIVVAATAAAISSRFNSFSTIGGIIGTSVSAAFLIILGLMNMYILYKLIKQMQKVLSLPKGQEDEIWKIEGGGPLFRILKKMFRLIDRPWKMYPLGILFGLGFDTSSEIALLGISSVEAASGTDFWVILIFPILFTAGMCLLDTTDGALMLSLYVQPATNFLPPKQDTEPLISEELEGEELRNDGQKNHRDPIAFLYYSIVLTCLTVLVAIVIGVIQVLSLVLNVANPTGKFWDGVQTASDYYDAIGGGIAGCFVIVGILSVILYKPWRRWIAKRYREEVNSDEEACPQDSSTTAVPINHGEDAAKGPVSHRR
ncbi:nickel transport protein [Penicillium malachiteum]|nr:nickel transport protein [Penicillium malachiteum]